MTATRANAPGRSYRGGLTLLDQLAMLPDEETAKRWFEDTIWADERCYGKCGSVCTRLAKHATMPHWCSDCRSYFSVRPRTPMSHSKIPLRKWAIAVYLCLASLKSVSSMKLHRDLGVSQPAAWFMLMRIREAWKAETEPPFAGPVEVDETYVGGRQRNMSEARRARLPSGGGSHMTAVVGARDRDSNQVAATVVRSTDSGTLQGFVVENTDPEATVYTDDARAYRNLPRTTGSAPAPGRSDSVRRNSARASFSGVAPMRSRSGSSIGRIFSLLGRRTPRRACPFGPPTGPCARGGRRYRSESLRYRPCSIRSRRLAFAGC